MEITPEEIVAALQKRDPMLFNLCCADVVIARQQAEIERLQRLEVDDDSPSDG